MATCRCGHCASGYTGGARHFAPSLGSFLLPHLWNHTRLCFHVLPSDGPFIYSPPCPLTGSASKRKTLPLCSRLTIHSFTLQLPRGQEQLARATSDTQSIHKRIKGAQFCTTHETEVNLAQLQNEMGVSLRCLSVQSIQGTACSPPVL